MFVLGLIELTDLIQDSALGIHFAKMLKGDTKRRKENFLKKDWAKKLCESLRILRVSL